MTTFKQVRAHVLSVYNRDYPGQVVEATDMRVDLRWINPQVLSYIDNNFQGWQGARLLRNEMLACKTILNVSELIWLKIGGRSAHIGGPGAAGSAKPARRATPKSAPKPRSAGKRAGTAKRPV